MHNPLLEKLADVLVNYSVGVKRGQIVRITGAPVSQPLAVELYRKVVHLVHCASCRYVGRVYSAALLEQELRIDPDKH